MSCYQRTDLNECELYQPCIHADCYNLNGNYTCGVCDHGFNRTNLLFESQEPCGNDINSH